MDDRLAALERRLAEAEKTIGHVRHDLATRVDQAFRWSVTTIVVGLIITWFGALLLLTRGASLIRRFMLS